MMDDRLSEHGFWKYKNAVMIETLAGVMEILNACPDLESAKGLIKHLHNGYELASWPGVKDESTDHLL